MHVCLYVSQDKRQTADTINSESLYSFDNVSQAKETNISLLIVILTGILIAMLCSSTTTFETLERVAKNYIIDSLL